MTIMWTTATLADLRLGDRFRIGGIDGIAAELLLTRARVEVKLNRHIPGRGLTPRSDTTFDQMVTRWLPARDAYERFEIHASPDIPVERFIDTRDNRLADDLAHFIAWTDQQRAELIERRKSPMSDRLADVLAEDEANLIASRTQAESMLNAIDETT